MTIVDASVAIKWFVDEEEGQVEAFTILDEIRRSPENFGVPELFFNEMLSILCRLVSEEREVFSYLESLELLGWSRIGNGRDLLKEAAKISIRYGVTGYDAIYAASASLCGGKWITADVKAHRRLAKLKITLPLIGD